MTRHTARPIFRVLATAALVCTLSLIVLFGVDAHYRQMYNVGLKMPRKLLPNPPITEKYQLVKVGNSHAQDGVLLSQFRTKSLDLSGVAQRFEFDLALLKQHRAEIDEGAVILINVSPISFAHTAANSLKGFQSGYYGRVSPFFIPHLNVADYIESEVFGFTRAGHLLRKKYDEQVQERIAREEKWPEHMPSPTPAAPQEMAPEITAATPAITKEQERARDSIVSAFPRRPPISVTKPVIKRDFTAAVRIEQELASPSAHLDGVAPFADNLHFTFNKWYHTDEFSPEYFPVNRKDLENLIRYTKQQRWRPVLITVPISAHLEEGLLDDYMQKYLYEQMDLVDLQGVEYIDFSTETRLTNNKQFFSNSDHLNKHGALVLTYLLMQELVKRGYLPASVDGYDYTR